MKIFFSYPSGMHPVVENIHQHLPHGVFDPWIDTQRIRAGTSLTETIKQNIRDSECFISFLNAEAMQSAWVRQELAEAALQESITGRLFIIPVLLNDFSDEDLPEFLRDRRYLSYGGSNYPRQIAMFAQELSDELLRLACERTSLRCEGMAAVYFFSFVEPFLGKLDKAENLCLKWPAGEKDLKSLKRPELRVLLPEILDEPNLTDLLARPNLRDGVLLAGTETIFRKVLFDKAIETESEADVVFYDVPNILFPAAKLFAQERGLPDWSKRNRMELLAFKYNIERLADINLTTRRLRARLKIETPADGDL